MPAPRSSDSEQGRARTTDQLADRIVNSREDSYTVSKMDLMSMKSEGNMPRCQGMFVKPESDWATGYADNVMCEVMEKVADRTGSWPMVYETDDTRTFKK